MDVMCNLDLPESLQAIMLVESVDGEHALLGRPRSLSRRGPVLTCLSGFIEQGESIEEAVSDPTSPSHAGVHPGLSYSISEPRHRHQSQHMPKL
jgi:hypothetical protein